jgi:O-antigen/teichoic acid export membrane protein
MSLKNNLKDIIKGKFARNVFTVLSGNTISQIIPFLFYPIITRIYEPSEFALLSLFTATVLIFSNISTMQYHKAIMVAEDQDEAVNVLALTIICVLFMTIISAFVVIAFNHFILELMDNEKMKIWLYLVPISVFLTGITNTLSLWASKHKAFKRLAIEKVSNKASSLLSKIGLGYMKYTNAGLILGTIIGQVFSNVYLIIQTLKDRVHIKTVSFKDMKRMMYKYRHFPIYSNVSKSGGAIKESALRYVISNFFGASVLGSFSFTYGIMMRPLSLIGSAVSNVFFEKISDLSSKKKDIWPIQKKIIAYLSLIGILLLLPVFLFGEQLFGLVFGEKWIEAGSHARLMTPWLFAIFISSPLLSLNYVLNKQRQYMYISVGVNILFPVILLMASLMTTDFNTVLVIISWAGFFINMYWIVWVRKMSLEYQFNKEEVSY